MWLRWANVVPLEWVWAICEVDVDRCAGCPRCVAGVECPLGGGRAAATAREELMAMKINLKQWLVWLTIAFVIVFIYRDQRCASDVIGPFLGDIGHLLTNIIHSGAEFLAGFGNR